MALPPAHTTNEAMEAIERYYRSISINDLEALTGEDCRIIGEYIQVYNFIELNLRRSLSLFERADLIKASNKADMPSTLIPRTKEAVSRMAVSAEETERTLAQLNEIEFRWSFRNLLAHWAAQRIPQYDALVFLSFDRRDSKQLDVQLKFSECHFAIIRVPDLRGLLKHISTIGLWHARKTADWHSQYGS